MSQVLKELTEKLQELPEDRLQEVLDFVESLRSQSTPRRVRGSPEALLPHAGAWTFTQGELEGLLADLERLRELELEREP